jgi:hypothetical protein
MAALLREPGGIKEGSVGGTYFHGGLAGKPGRGLICWGLTSGKGSGKGVSPYRGSVRESG